MLYYNIESGLALVVTLFINVCVVSTFAKGFYGTAEQGARARGGKRGAAPAAARCACCCLPLLLPAAAACCCLLLPAAAATCRCCLLPAAACRCCCLPLLPAACCCLPPLLLPAAAACCCLLLPAASAACRRRCQRWRLPACRAPPASAALCATHTPAGTHSHALLGRDWAGQRGRLPGARLWRLLLAHLRRGPGEFRFFF